MNSITITISIPHRALSPNARTHWRAKAVKVKAARRAASVLCVATVGHGHMLWTNAISTVVWYAKTATHPDPDNALAMLKPYFDGLADAGVLGHDAAGAPVIIDYKTRKTKPKQGCKPYDTQGMQLAAYAVAHYGLDRLPEVKAWNVYISTTEIGRVEGYQHESLLPHWEAFKAAAILWSHIKGYDPRRPVFTTLKEAA